MQVLAILWYIVIIVQGIMSYGTAYRLTKNGGDNGVSLFGWFFVLGFASLIPGLGIYLWLRYRELDCQEENIYQQELFDAKRKAISKKICSKCELSYDEDMSSCPHCGFREK